MLLELIARLIFHLSTHKTCHLELHPYVAVLQCIAISDREILNINWVALKLKLIAKSKAVIV